MMSGGRCMFNGAQSATGTYGAVQLSGLSLRLLGH